HRRKLRLAPAERLDERIEGGVLRRVLLAQEVEAERRLGALAREGMAGDESAVPPDALALPDRLADLPAGAFRVSGEELQLDPRALGRLAPPRPRIEKSGRVRDEPHREELSRPRGEKAARILAPGGGQRIGEKKT